MELRPLERSESGRAAELAAKAFAEDPGFAFITGKRPELLPSLFRAELRVDLASGGRLLGAFGPELLGFAVWVPPGPRPHFLRAWLPELPALWPFLARPLSLARALRLQAAVQVGRDAWPAAAYLRLLAVDPCAQGRGAGAALIESVAAAAGTDVYLETAAEANVGYYRLRGFSELGRVEGRGLPPFWRMLRSR